MPNLIAVTYAIPELKLKAEELAAQLQLPLVNLEEKSYPILLKLTKHYLELSFLTAQKTESIYVDFLTSKAKYRQNHGGGRKQLVARAVGLHQKKTVTVCDLTAGLGQDAFVLATLGAQITMVERSPIIGALLQDGWERARQVEWIQQLSWQFLMMDSFTYLRQLPDTARPQVIYLDPMFPERKKSALMKKEMRILRYIIGDDHDAGDLLTLSLQTAKERVVVKRPRLAEAILSAIKPDSVLIGKSSRFDIYFTGINQ